MGNEAAPQARGWTFTLFDMPVSVPLSGLLGVGLIAWLWAPSFGSDGSGVPAAIVFAVLLYGAILVHELAHGLTARAFGNHVHGITLWILGGFTVYERAGLTPAREAAIAASGPFATLAIAAGAQGLVVTIGDSLPDVAYNVLAALVWTNFLLGVLNLLPGLPLDGGGIVRALAWGVTGNEHRGTAIAAWTGRILAIVVVGLTLGLAALPGSGVGLITVVVAAVFGVFIWAGATAALRQSRIEVRIPQLAAGSLARRAVPARFDESLALAHQRMVDAQAGAIVIVDESGHPAGIVNDAAAAATPVERRPWIPVRSLLTPLPPTATVSIDISGADLIAALRAARAPAVLVLDDSGAIYGVLVIDDVERALG